MEAITTAKIILTDKELKVLSNFIAMINDEINISLSNEDIVDLLNTICDMKLSKKDVDTYDTEDGSYIDIVIEESEE